MDIDTITELLQRITTAVLTVAVNWFGTGLPVDMTFGDLFLILIITVIISNATVIRSMTAKWRT